MRSLVSYDRFYCYHCRDLNPVPLSYEETIANSATLVRISSGVNRGIRRVRLRNGDVSPLRRPVR